MIGRKMAAGDAAWGDALITRLAEILQRDGDLDAGRPPLQGARGLLISQPAEALRLLNAHQDDDQARRGRGAVEEPEDPAPSPMPTDPESTLRQEPEGTGVRSGPRRGRGRCGSGRRRSTRPRPGPGPSCTSTSPEEALSAGLGVARVEEVGPVLLTRLRQPARGPLPDPAETGHRPQRHPGPGRQLRNPRPAPEHLHLRQPVDVFPYAAGGSRRTDLDHTIAYLPIRPGRPAGPNRRSGTWGRWSVTTTASAPTAPGRSGNPNPAATVAVPQRPHLPGQRHRHPPARPRPLRPASLASR